MTREEVEKIILEKLKEIQNVVLEYTKGANDYLSMCVYEDWISVNNRYWESEKPINASTWI